MGTIKPWEELSFRDDYMFKRVMRHKRFCKRMLEKILRIEIRDIRYLEDEKTIKTAYESKGIRLDVYVEDDRNTVYNVELQVRKPEKDGLFKRTRYYQSMIDGDLLMAGARYDTLKDTIIIFICPFEVLDGKRHMYTFRNICVEDRETVMPDGATKILLSTKGTLNDVTPDMEAFLEYVDGKTVNDDFVQEIDKEIKNIKGQESERVSYMTYAMKIQEERDEAKAEGIVEGRTKGKVEAIKSLMEKKGWSIDEALDALSIPKVEWNQYKTAIQG